MVFGAWGIGGVRWPVQITNNKKPALGGRGVLCASVDYFAGAGAGAGGVVYPSIWSGA